MGSINHLLSSNLSLLQKAKAYAAQINPSINKEPLASQISLITKSKRALVVRAYGNQTGFPVLRSLSKDFNWNILFASWNQALEYPVRQMGINYIDLKNFNQRIYRSYIKKHKRSVNKLFTKLSVYEPGEFLSTITGIQCRFNSKSLFFEDFVMARVYTDIYFKLIAEFKPEVIVLFNAVSPPGKTMAKVARLTNIPSVSVQHGLFGGEIYNDLATDKILVWGVIPKNFWLDRGCSPDQVEIVGAFGHDKWMQMKVEEIPGANKSSRKNVLFTGQFPSINLSAKQHQDTIKAVLNAASQLPHIDFILKAHPGKDIGIYRELIAAKGGTNVKLIYREPIEPLLRKCDLVITIFSATGIEAMLLRRPVLILNLSSTPPIAPYASAAYVVNQRDELATAISRILEDQSFRNTLVESGNKFTKDYLGPMDGKASWRAAEAITRATTR